METHEHKKDFKEGVTLSWLTTADRWDLVWAYSVGPGASAPRSYHL